MVLSLEFYKVLENTWAAAKLAVSQGGPRSVELGCGLLLLLLLLLLLHFLDGLISPACAHVECINSEIQISENLGRDYIHWQSAHRKAGDHAGHQKNKLRGP
jgi:hypothetical protein